MLEILRLVFSATFSHLDGTRLYLTKARCESSRMWLDFERAAVTEMLAAVDRATEEWNVSEEKHRSPKITKKKNCL